MSMDIMPLLMFIGVCAVLLAGFRLPSRLPAPRSASPPSAS